MTDFSENTALKIMNTKLRGKPQSAVYELSDAELSLLRGQLENWTIGMSQVLANRIGDLEQTQRVMSETIILPENKRTTLATLAGEKLEAGEIPPNAAFAAFILANHSDQLHIEKEINRRSNLN